MSKKLINNNGGKKQNADWYNQEFQREYINGNRLNNQEEFRKYVEDNCIHKTNYDRYFVSQGLCHSGDYALTTSYYKKPDLSEFKDIIMSFGSIKAYAAEDVVNTNSRVDIHDVNGNNKTLYFDHDFHVGGIAYHEASGKFYVSKGKDIAIYDEDDIAKAKHNDTINRIDDFEIAKEVKQSSYVAVHNDDFYVGKWERGEKNAKLAKYEIDHETGNVSDNPTIYSVPYSDVQGMEIYEKNGQEYYIFSSTDNFAEAKLHVAVLNNGKFESVGVLDVPGALEQISINKDGKLGMVFESDCVAYNVSSNPIGEIMYMDIDKAIDDMEIKKEKYIDKFSKIYDKDKDGEVDNIDKWNRLFNSSETASDYISNAKNWVEETFHKGMRPIDEFMDKNTDFDKDGKSDLKEGLDWIDKKINNALDFDRDGENEISEVYGNFKGLFKSGLDYTIEKGKDIVDDIGQTGKKVINTVGEKANNATDFDRDGKSDVIEAGEWVADKAEKGAKAVYNKGKEIVDDIGDGLDKAGDWAKDKWDDFIDLF